jgi:hypothetical protein
MEERPESSKLKILQGEILESPSEEYEMSFGCYWGTNQNELCQQ